MYQNPGKCTMGRQLFYSASCLSFSLRTSSCADYSLVLNLRFRIVSNMLMQHWPVFHLPVCESKSVIGETKCEIHGRWWVLVFLFLEKDQQNFYKYIPNVIEFDGTCHIDSKQPEKTQWQDGIGGGLFQTIQPHPPRATLKSFLCTDLGHDMSVTRSWCAVNE